MKFPIRNNVDLPNPKSMKGLGDLISKIAEPVKQVMLKHGPDQFVEYLKNCNCDKRKEFLNKLVPFGH